MSLGYPFLPLYGKLSPRKGKILGPSLPSPTLPTSNPPSNNLFSNSKLFSPPTQLHKPLLAFYLHTLNSFKLSDKSVTKWVSSKWKKRKSNFLTSKSHKHTIFTSTKTLTFRKLLTPSLWPLTWKKWRKISTNSSFPSITEKWLIVQNKF